MDNYKVKRKDNVVRIKDVSDGFIDKNATVCKVVDTGNGYIVKFPAVTSYNQHYYVCLDYSQADYLRVALNEVPGERP